VNSAEPGKGSPMTPLVLVALDASERAELALATGARLATKVDGDVIAVHIVSGRGRQNGSVERVREVAHAANVPLFVREGSIAAELGDAYLELRACAIVASGAVARDGLTRVPIAVAVAPNDGGPGEIDLVGVQPVSTQSPYRAAQSG
jgi:nucleotide-binding universal stress UspA family protein